MIVSPAILGLYVQTQFDTGARGLSTLYGRIVQAGKKTATIKWESGIRNRIRSRPDINLCSGEQREEARKAMALVGTET